MKFILVVLLLHSSLLFAQENYVCLGSFKDEDNAKKFVAQLERYKIPCIISEYKKDNETFYRVLFSEEYENKDMADLHKSMLRNLPILRELNINGIWSYQKEEIPVVINENRVLIIKDSDTGVQLLMPM